MQEKPKAGVEKLIDAVLGSFPRDTEAWKPLALGFRQSFLSAVATFSGLLASAYLIWGIVLFAAVDSFPEAFSAIAVLAAMSVQAVYGGTFGLARSEAIGALDLESTVGVVAFPSLLTIGIVVAASFLSRRILRTLTAHRSFAALALPFVFALSSVVLIWVLSFVTNRYAVFSPNYELLGVLPGVANVGISVATITAGGAATALAILLVPSVLAGLFLLHSDRAFFREFGWLLRTLRTFAIAVLGLGLAAGSIYLLYRWISVEFGAAPEVSSTAEFEWTLLLAFVAVIIIFLPTLLLNLLWMAGGAQVGIQADAVNRFPLYDLTSEGLFEDALLLGETFSLWDENPVFASFALAVFLGVAMFSGAISANYSRFRPRSFWSLAVFSGAAIVFGLILRWFSSSQFFFRTKITGDTPENFDSSDYLSGLQIGQFGFSWGVSELAAIALVLGMVVSAFIGSKYFAAWVPGLFPRLGSAVSLRKLELGIMSGRSAAQLWLSRISLSSAIAFAAVSLVLATAERILAMVDNPERYVSQLAQGLMSDSPSERKAIFATLEGYEWLTDDALPVSGRPFEDGLEIEILGSGGGEWQPGSLEAFAIIKSPGQQPVELKFPVRANVESYPLGFQRAAFSGLPYAPTISLETSAVLNGNGFPAVLVNEVPTKSGRLMLLPGSYSVALEATEVTEAFETQFLAQAGTTSVRVEPKLRLPDSVLSEIDLVANELFVECESVNEAGNPSCDGLASREPSETYSSADPPDDYFDFDSQFSETANVICGDSGFEIMSATTVLRRQPCTWSVDELRTYFDATEARQVVNKRYGYLPNGNAVYCSPRWMNGPWPTLRQNTLDAGCAFVTIPPQRKDEIFSGTFTREWAVDLSTTVSVVDGEASIDGVQILAD